jgi:catechol 2,3-dioxygenase-like lactoylglutathione lyase family enzyme
MPTTLLQARGLVAGLTVNDIELSTRFYTEALGFAVKQRDEEGGKVRFVMLEAGAAQVGLGQDDFARGRNRSKGVGMRFWIMTSQPLEPLAAQIKAAGFALDSEIAPLPWGPPAFALSDPDGFKFTISREG